VKAINLRSGSYNATVVDSLGCTFTVVGIVIGIISKPTRNQPIDSGSQAETILVVIGCITGVASWLGIAALRVSKYV